MNEIEATPTNTPEPTATETEVATPTETPEISPFDRINSAVKSVKRWCLGNTAVIVGLVLTITVWSGVRSSELLRDLTRQIGGIQSTADETSASVGSVQYKLDRSSGYVTIVTTEAGYTEKYTGIRADSSQLEAWYGDGLTVYVERAGSVTEYDGPESWGWLRRLWEWI